jgi:hypothetical protein
MKRCSTCQRTFADDNLTFCLDDGSPLLTVDTNWADSQATASIPEPRQTNPQPLPPVFNQPANPGIQFNSRTLAIIGSSLLILGVFMPLISFLGLISISYFQLAQFSAKFSTGIVVALAGIVSLILALKNQYKPLIAAGLLALVILLIDFFRIKSAIASGLPLQLPGQRPGMDPAMMGQALQSVIQISWGMFVMVAGAILLIVAGAKKDKAHLSSTDWKSNPPPPMNYS